MMVKINQRKGNVPFFPDNEEMSVEFSSEHPEQPVVFKFVSHYYWEDGSDHPSTLLIYYDVESAEKLLSELQVALHDARKEKAMKHVDRN